jgi:hypothetical protein
MGGTEVKPIGFREIFRSAEDEGAGGASGFPGEGASPAPVDTGGDDKLSALEQRLARITQSVEGLTQQQQRERAMGAVSARANELTNAKKTAEDGVNVAEKKLAEAYDNGEGIEIAKAQRALTEAVAKRERADMELTEFQRQVKASEQKKPDAGSMDDTNLRDWKQRHSAWYGVDAELTKASHEIDRQIRAAGVLSVGSKEYFNAIDRAMSQKYPDRFGGSPNSSGGTRGAAPVSGGRVTINRSVADGYRRMGINIDDPKVAERMVKNRQVLVEKGILPAQPVGGPVVTR